MSNNKSKHSSKQKPKNKNTNSKYNKIKIRNNIIGVVIGLISSIPFAYGFIYYGAILVLIACGFVMYGHIKTLYLSIILIIIFILISIFSHSLSNKKNINLSTNLTQPINKLENAEFRFTSDLIKVIIGSNTVEYTKNKLLNKKCLFTLDSYCIVFAYINENKLFFDVNLPTRDPRGNIKIKNNSIIELPPFWDFNFNENNLEIVDDKLNPILQIKYILDTYIQINCIIEKKDTIVCINDTVAKYVFSLNECNINRIFKYPFNLYPHEVK